MKEIKIAIIGGGPSGVYCALQLISALKNTCIENIYNITLFEKEKPLKTLLPTGNGRCNITNGEENFKIFASNYPRGEKFLLSVFSRYFTPETLEYFESLKIKTYKQPDNRIFPVSNSAKNVAESLFQAILNSKKVKIVKKNVKNPEELRQFGYIVLATGSKDRGNLAQQFGHTIIPLAPCLCGVKVKDKGPNFPTGVSFNSSLGGIIFTHLGISGPAIFKITSINAQKGYPYDIKIPIIPPDKLFDELKNSPNKSFGNLAAKFAPKSLIKFIFEKEGLNFDKKACQVSKKEIEKLETLTMIATGPDGKGEIVHSGGVLLDEVDKNLKSKICPNLWIIGECLNIDGFCGGFNLQNCWSTGAIAAQNIAETILTNLSNNL